MKKLFLLIGVILSCTIISCKKDNPPPPPPPPPPPVVDSFLLHPPPVTDSLPIPLTIGTWWKYQRVDSIHYTGVIFNPQISNYDSSIEVMTVIGKTPIINSAYSDKNGITRSRYDTVESILMELKNLTHGTLDTIHAFYYMSSFFIYPNIGEYKLFIKVPIQEGAHDNAYFLNYPYSGNNMYGNTNVIKNISVTMMNLNFSNCIYYVDSIPLVSNIQVAHNLKTYLIPGIGFVEWDYLDYRYSQRGEGYTSWYYRRLIDYHIAP